MERYSQLRAFEKMVIKGLGEQTWLQIVRLTVEVGMHANIHANIGEQRPSRTPNTEEEFKSEKDHICSFARRASFPSDKGHGAPTLLALR